MWFGNKSRALEIEVALLEVVSEKGFVHSELITLYSQGKDVNEVFEILGGPMNYIRTQYISLYKLSLENGIPLP